jgi:hypothetical protein
MAEALPQHTSTPHEDRKRAKELQEARMAGTVRAQSPL